MGVLLLQVAMAKMKPLKNCKMIEDDGQEILGCWVFPHLVSFNSQEMKDSPPLSTKIVFCEAYCEACLVQAENERRGKS